METICAKNDIQDRTQRQYLTSNKQFRLKRKLRTWDTAPVVVGHDTDQQQQS